MFEPNNKTDFDNITAECENGDSSYPLCTADFSEVLSYFGLPFKPHDYYLHVGELKQVQGWILHITVVLSQIHSLLKIVVPYLVEHSLPFKLIMDISVGDDILNGKFGLHQVGKILSIYPQNDKSALSHATALIELCKPFKGPAIPTDLHLGSVVYARYGSHSAIIMADSTGNEEKFIYDLNGTLCKDMYFIPFQLPAGVAWPFLPLASPIPPKPKTILKGIYKPTMLLKSDPRGNVYKGIYLKSLLNIKQCVIKQGIENMSSDKAGRAVQDRLCWQEEIYNDLYPSIPMPRCLDLFHESGATYLVMEFIKGKSLLEMVEHLNPYSASWLELEHPKAERILQYLITLTVIIATFHSKGFVHRDIVPVNFMIDNKDNVILIDLELVYSLKWGKPNPPFAQGTAGFMSAEQIVNRAPTTKEDIYGLGASLLMILTGLTPGRFNFQARNCFRENLHVLIGDTNMANLLVDCMDPDPKSRPEISIILDAIRKFKTDYSRNSDSKKSGQKNFIKKALDSKSLKECIDSAIKGLSSESIVSHNDIWYSRRKDGEFSHDPRYNIYSKYIGIKEGVGGVLYVLARLAQVGIDIACCMPRIRNSWKYMIEIDTSVMNGMNPGLYFGAAGVALALSECIAAGLIENSANNKSKIKTFLTLENTKLSLPIGLTGQCIAALRCNELLMPDASSNLAESLKQKLLRAQDRYGTWIETITDARGKSKEVSLPAYEITGILWFLFEYANRSADSEAYKAAEKGLVALLKNKAFLTNFLNILGTKSSYHLDDGPNMSLAMLIKAYETTGETRYKLIAEKALSKLPTTLVSTNFTQYNGMSGLGEIYIDAYRVLGKEEYKLRSDWLARLFMQLLYTKPDGAGFWVMDEASFPTADFLVGNSGIVHFLARCLEPNRIGYRLLQ